MTFTSFIHQSRRLLSGKRKDWRYLPYRLRMKCLGLDLSWVSARESGLSEDHSSWHSNSGGPDLDAVLKTLTISPKDSALDVGCGKGGAMLTMARYPFTRVDGVELSPKLAEIAKRNLRTLTIHNATVYCCDAADFLEFDRYTLLYLYHPFPQLVMKKVLNNVLSSLRRYPRTQYILYKNAVYQDDIIAAGFRMVSEFDHDQPTFKLFMNVSA